MDRVNPTEGAAPRYPTDALTLRLSEARLAGAPLAIAVLAALSGALLVLEFATGALLALYYRPDRETARASVQFIVTRVEFGELVRSIHVWGSHALLATLFALVGAALFAGLHRKPGEVAWVALVTAWFLALASAFTGAILPWTARSSLDATVAAEATAKLPLVGPTLRAIVFGAASQPADLVRTQGIHLGALPSLWGLVLLVVVFHALGRLVQDPPREGAKVFPDVVMRAAAACVAVFAGLVALAAWRPAGLAEAPSAAQQLTGDVRPNWYLAPIDGLLRVAPPQIVGVSGVTVLVSLAAVGALAALALPLVDRNGGRLGQRIGLALYALLLGVMTFALLR